MGHQHMPCIPYCSCPLTIKGRAVRSYAYRNTLLYFSLTGKNKLLTKHCLSVLYWSFCANHAQQLKSCIRGSGFYIREKKTTELFSVCIFLLPSSRGCHKLVQYYWFQSPSFPAKNMTIWSDHIQPSAKFLYFYLQIHWSWKNFPLGQVLVYASIL